MTTGLKILDELLLKQDPAVLKKINNNFIQQELLAGALASAGYGEYLVMKEQRDSLERKSLKACEGLPPCLAKELVNPGIAKLDTILDEMYESIVNHPWVQSVIKKPEILINAITSEAMKNTS